jgi:hypothetical protein
MMELPDSQVLRNILGHVPPAQVRSSSLSVALSNPAEASLVVDLTARVYHKKKNRFSSSYQPLQ